MKAENLQIAVKYNFFQLSNLPEHVMQDKYFSERFADYSAIFDRHKVPEGLGGLKNVEVGVFAEVLEEKNHKGEHELYYIDHVYTLAFSPNCEVPLMLAQSKGKYYFHPIYAAVREIQASTTYKQREPYISPIHEPNRIGVFTEKKIADWVEYCNVYIEACKKCSFDLRSKEQENKQYIKSVIDALPDAKASTVRNWTTIETKLFYIEFELLNGGDYLSKKVTFKGSIRDIIRLQA